MSQYYHKTQVETFGDYSIFQKHSLLKGLMHNSGRVILDNIFSEMEFDPLTNTILTTREVCRRSICFDIKETIRQRFDFEGNKVALLDGKVVKLPSQYESCGDFKNGLARVQRLLDSFTPCAELGRETSRMSLCLLGNPLLTKTPCHNIILNPWGYVDYDFNEVIPCQYKRAEDFSDGLALVNEGYINTYGELVVKNEFSEARSFCNGYAAVKCKVADSHSQETQSWQFIDTIGNVVMTISKYIKTVFDVHCGKVRYIDYDNHYGFIDISSEEKISGIPYAEDFDNETANIKLNPKSDIVYKMNLRGEVEFLLEDESIWVPFDKIDFSHITSSFDKSYIVTHERNTHERLGNRIGLLGKNGLCIPTVFKSIAYNADRGYFVVEYDKFDSKEHYISINGKSLIQYDGNNYHELNTLYWQFEKLSDNLYKVGHSLVGVIDGSGNVLVSEKYNNVRLLNDLQIFEVYTDWNKLYYNLEGKQVAFEGNKIIVLENEYDEVALFTENRCAVKKDWMWGFVDHTGKEIIPCKYDHVQNFSEGRCVVVNEDGISIIDEQGKIVHQSSIYAEVSDYTNGSAVVSFRDIPISSNSYCILTPREINRNGELILKNDEGLKFLDKRYLWYDILSFNLIEVYSGKKYGLLDVIHNEILSCNYDKIKYDDTNRRLYLEIDKTYEEAKTIIDVDLNRLTKTICITRIYVTCNDSKLYHIYNSIGHYLFSIECVISRPISSSRTLIWNEGEKFYRLISASGEIIAENFTKVGFEENGVIPIVLDGKKRYINRNGDITDLPTDDFRCGIAIVDKSTRTRYMPFNKPLKGAVDRSGRYVISPIYSQLKWDVTNDILIGKYGNESYRFNCKGEIIVEIGDRIINIPGYDTCDPIGNDLIRVSKDGLVGFINTELKEVFPLTRFEYSKPYVMNGKYYIERSIEPLSYHTPTNLINEIDTDARIITYKDGEKIVLPCEYSWAELWMGEYLPVECKGSRWAGTRWGIVDENLDVVLECNYMKIIGIKNDVAIALNRLNQLVKIDLISKNEEVLNYVYISNTLTSVCVRHFGHWLDCTTLDIDNYGLIDFEGNIILECIHNEQEVINPSDVLDTIVRVYGNLDFGF